MRFGSNTDLTAVEYCGRSVSTLYLRLLMLSKQFRDEGRHDFARQRARCHHSLQWVGLEVVQTSLGLDSDVLVVHLPMRFTGMRRREGAIQYFEVFVADDDTLQHLLGRW